MKTAIPAKPDHVTWTDDQWKAILAKDQDILVAAAAGSGKTAVLVERIIRKIVAEQDPIDVDQLLVVTFTNASAAEMRNRIGAALEAAIDERPDSAHLRKQLSLLNKASISTLHSFCLDVVRKYYYMIDIDPGFRIADETEAALIRDEVLDEIFEEEYGNPGNESFFRLVDTYSSDRSDHALQDLVLKLHDFSRSHPSPDGWLKELVRLYDVPEHASMEDLPFTELLKKDIFLQLDGAKDLLQQAYGMTKLPGGPAPRAANYLEDLSAVEGLQKAAYKSWAQLHEAMNCWSFGRAKPCKGDEYDPDLVKEADGLRKKAKGILDKLKEELFSRPPERYLQDMREMKPVLETLVSVVASFGSKFQSVKAEKGLADFSDLEHFCLGILMDQGKAGNPAPSDIALGYRNQFKEVLVDEYQDTNMVQETILRLVAADGEYDGNLFMVGDVKQSIYRFRLAEPNLFLGKYVRFSSDGEKTGLRIDLSRNFRSRAEVLDATNFIFKQVMGVNIGEIEYGTDAELIKGSGYQEDEPFPVEVAIIDQADGRPDMDNGAEGTGEEGFSRTELEQSRLEARYMSRKIREMVDRRYPIYDLKKGATRPVQYRDIVILLRSMTWAPDIMEEFKDAGIPVYANVNTGYFEATEVAIMMSLLKMIDNPDQDIPLASVMRSPIVGLNEEELAHIRLYSKRGSYYEAAKQFAKGANHPAFVSAQKRVAELFSRLDSWRAMARGGALSALIWQLYRDTGFYEFAGGLPGGKQRQANLRALYDRARQYEATSFRGLFRFLRFIERMRERGNDLGAARALGEQEDVVRIMTIHSSKGLEFPVVIAGGLGRKFNMMDINASFMFDKEYGFASKYINPEKRISYSSLPQLALRRKKRLETLAEEMRVLYVAMTRAKEKLFLVGTVKDADKEKKKWKGASSQTNWLLPDYERYKAASYLDWIGAALTRHRDGIKLADESISAPDMASIAAHSSKWRVDIIEKGVLEKGIELEEADESDWLSAVREGAAPDHYSDRKKEVFERLSWEYRHPLASKRMSKQSVTELKRIAEMFDDSSSMNLIRTSGDLLYKRPSFMQDKSLSPAERGTAMHTVMQHIPIDEMPTRISVELLLEELVQKEILTEEQAESVQGEHVVQFFESPIGQKMLKADRVRREVPFTMGIPAREIYADWDGEEEAVLVQGIIDCVIEEKDGVLLLDYKTDAIMGRYPGGFEQAKSVMERRYRTQLAYYERAIRNIWKKPVKGKVLYFFDAGKVLEL
ncbi:MAG TPA: helicase-exonuclease AddAB subunit AddA [Bacillaceae bacterium]